MGTASGKLDALVFMGGLVIGIVAFAEAYSAITSFAWSGEIGVRTLPELLGLSSWVVAVIVVGMALLLFWLAGVAESARGGRES